MKFTIEELLSLIELSIDEKINDIPIKEGRRGVRGPRGFSGSDGRDGINGKDGNDGESFSWDKYKDLIYQRIDENKLEFSDLTKEELESLRGPRGFRGQKGKSGVDGVDGKDFVWEDHKEKIINHLNTLKLKFSDLSEEEKQSLVGERGPRGLKGSPGKDGKDGKDFSWDEIKEEVLNRVDSNKLKFSDFTDEERESLRGDRGPRGQRGKQGPQGDKGDKGEIGLTGAPGIPGINGRDGKNGIDGEDGKDAPAIVDIQLKEWNNKFYFVFWFDNGNKIETKKIDKPIISQMVQNIVSGGGGGYRSYLSTKIEYDASKRVSVVMDYVDNDSQLLGRKEEVVYSGNLVDYVIQSIYSAEGNDENEPNKLIVENKIDLIYIDNFVQEIKVTEQ